VVLPGGHKRRHKTTSFIFGSTSELSTETVYIIVNKLDVVQYILHVKLYVGIYLKQELVFSFHSIYKIIEKVMPLN
jgi:hypothetical protein